MWRAPGDTTVTFTAIGGSTNTALANSDLSADVVNHAGVIELGADVRRLVFTGADVSAGSALFAWHPNDLWRLEARYTYSLTSFKATGQSSGDNSVLLREIWQAWRRAALQGSYAQGIESFEDLTSDRLGALSATTVAGGLRVDLPSLTRITATWEYQWRSNDTRINRITVSMVQFIR